MAIVDSYIRGEKLPVPYTPSGAAVVVDQIVVCGAAGNASVGVIQTAAADGVATIADIGGAYIMPKASAAAITVGETVNWDLSEGNVDDNAATAATGDVEDFGVALESAAATTTTVRVQLLPGNGAIA